MPIALRGLGELGPASSPSSDRALAVPDEGTRHGTEGADELPVAGEQVLGAPRRDQPAADPPYARPHTAAGRAYRQALRMVHPLALGSGKRLFDDVAAQVPWTLLDSQTFKTGRGQPDVRPGGQLSERFPAIKFSIGVVSATRRNQP